MGINKLVGLVKHISEVAFRRDPHRETPLGVHPIEKQQFSAARTPGED